MARSPGEKHFCPLFSREKTWTSLSAHCLKKNIEDIVCFDITMVAEGVGRLLC